jgi:hypothetical protein
MYKTKYLKYKNKYLNLKKGGAGKDNYVEFEYIDQNNLENIKALKDSFFMELEEYSTKDIVCHNLYNIINVEYKKKFRYKFYIKEIGDIKCYLVIITGVNDEVLKKVGKKYGFPRGFPIIWIPNKLLNMYGFYPKFENDKRKEDELNREAFKDASEMKFNFKYSGFLGQVISFELNGNYYWTTCAKNSSCNDYSRNIARLIESSMTDKLLCIMTKEHIHFCGETMSYDDQVHGARVLDEKLVVTLVAKGHSLEKIKISNSKNSSLHSHTRTVIQENCALTSFIEPFNQEEMHNFCMTYNLSVDKIFKITSYACIINFMLGLNDIRNFITLDLFMEYLDNFRSNNPENCSFENGNISHESVLGNILEGLIIKVNKTENKDPVTIKYKFPFYTSRTMLLRAYLGDYKKKTDESALNESALNEGALNEGALNEGALNEGTLNEGALNEGALKKSALKEVAPNESALKKGATNENSLKESVLNEDLEENIGNESKQNNKNNGFSNAKIEEWRNAYKNYINYWVVNDKYDGRCYWVKIFRALFKNYKLLNQQYNNYCKLTELSKRVGKHIFLMDKLIDILGLHPQLSNFNIKTINSNSKNLNSKVKVDVPIIFVFGPIGAGKSTISSMIQGINPGLFIHIDGDVLDLDQSSVYKLSSERNDYTKFKIVEQIIQRKIPVFSTGGGALLSSTVGTQEFSFFDYLEKIFNQSININGYILLPKKDDTRTLTVMTDKDLPIFIQNCKKYINGSSTEQNTILSTDHIINGIKAIYDDLSILESASGQREYSKNLTEKLSSSTKANFNIVLKIISSINQKTLKKIIFYPIVEKYNSYPSNSLLLNNISNKIKLNINKSSILEPPKFQQKRLLCSYSLEDGIKKFHHITMKYSNHRNIIYNNSERNLIGRVIEGLYFKCYLKKDIDEIEQILKFSIELRDEPQKHINKLNKIKMEDIIELIDFLNNILNDYNLLDNKDLIKSVIGLIGKNITRFNKDLKFPKIDTMVSVIVFPQDGLFNEDLSTRAHITVIPGKHKPDLMKNVAEKIYKCLKGTSAKTDKEKSENFENFFNNSIDCPDIQEKNKSKLTENVTEHIYERLEANSTNKSVTLTKTYKEKSENFEYSFNNAVDSTFIQRTNKPESMENVSEKIYKCLESNSINKSVTLTKTNRGKSENFEYAFNVPMRVTVKFINIFYI